MLDPYITPCCDQKLLRYFFERVDNAGHATFFSEEDYSLSQFLSWMVSRFPVSDFTIAIPEFTPSTAETLCHLLKETYYMFSEKKNVPLIHHLNLIVGRDTEIPQELLDNQNVTVAKDVFTYNYILVHKLWSLDSSNTNLEQDTEEQKKNVRALVEKAQALSDMLDNEATTKLAYEELEGAWIDYMLSSNLATSSKGTFYTLHGIVSQNRQTARLTSSVTCVKGKYAYDEVMNILGSILRTRKIKSIKQ